MNTLEKFFSQEEVKKDSLWTTRGNVAILLNQTGFSDWVGGGTNNFSGTIKFDYELKEKETIKKAEENCSGITSSR